MASLTVTEQGIIFKDPFAYCAHPHLAALPNGEWIIVFNRSVRRSFILHPPNDPHYYNVMIRSTDQGRTWDSPRVVPGFEWSGVECAGLTVLKDSTLLLNQWRFKWFPLETARKRTDATALYFPEDWGRELQLSGELDSGAYVMQSPADVAPWARGNDGAYVHRSTDGGRTWDQTARIDTAPYAGGYGMRGGVQLANGDILLPLSDVPHYRTVFIVRSMDGGCTWSSPLEVASVPGKEFEEPTTLILPDGKIVMLLRENRSRFLHQCDSTDAGQTWTAPRPTPIVGYPAQLLQLRDGRLLCVVGYRYAPYGIRVVISDDGGNSWDTEHELIVRDDLPNKDLGYPSLLTDADSQIYTVYYGQDADGVTCIQATRFILHE